MDTVVHQISLLEEHLLKLLDPSTTPENALQMLSSPCFSLAVNSNEDFKPVLIFLAYMKFIVSRFTYSCVDGICEDILRKTVVYSRNCSLYGEEISNLRRIYTMFVPTEYDVELFLLVALGNLSKCPNPYTRLELFRLLRIFRVDTGYFGHTRDSAWKQIIIHTINDIQPHRLYPNGYMNEIFYNIHDLSMNLSKFTEYWNSKKNLSYMSENINFFSNCIQLIGVFARIASSNPDHKKQMKEIQSCWLTFGMCSLEHFPNISDLKYRPYVVETIRELTSATINNKRRSKYKTNSICPLRDNIVLSLGIGTKPCDLPRLLLARQVQGPMAVHQHCLLLENLKPLYKNIPFNDSDLEDSDVEDNVIEDNVVEDSDFEESDTEINYIEGIDIGYRGVEDNGVEESDIIDNNDEESDIDESYIEENDIEGIDIDDSDVEDIDIEES